MFQYESNVNMLNFMVKCGEMSRDTKLKNYEISMKEQCIKIPSMTIVLPEMKYEVLSSDHMSRLHMKHVSPLHSSNGKLPLKCHHYGKLGHIRPYC